MGPVIVSHGEQIGLGFGGRAADESVPGGRSTFTRAVTGGMLKSDGATRRDLDVIGAGAVIGSFGPVRPGRRGLDSC
jgi:hypothetical protein